MRMDWGSRQDPIIKRCDRGSMAVSIGFHGTGYSQGELRILAVEEFSAFGLGFRVQGFRALGVWRLWGLTIFSRHTSFRKRRTRYY